MLIRFSGGSGGICEYLEFGRKSGRLEARDELDHRLPLSGNLNTVSHCLKSFDQNEVTQKYFHITLSFKEEVVDEETLQKIDDAFRQFIFSACREDEFYYYSEAHLPKIKQAIDVNGNEYERFPHIHVVIPQFNCYTGERDEPFGKIENITYYINSFQELINEKYGLASPKDNVRSLSFGREDILNRYQINPDLSVKNIKETIFQVVRDHPQISSVEDLAEVIRAFGETRIRDSKKFGAKYINILIPGKEKGINLKDPVFLDDYLSSRDLSVTHKFVSGAHQALLDEWQDYGALEARFFTKFSHKQRREYASMDLQGKKAVLRTRWEKHEEMLDSLASELQASREFERLPLVAPQLIRPHIDAIQSIEDLPHIEDIPHIDDVPHFVDLPSFDDQVLTGEDYEQRPTGVGRVNLYGVRVRSGHGNQRTRRRAALTAHILSYDQRPHVERNEEIQTQELYALPAKIGNSVTAGVMDHLTAQAETLSWSALINTIDARSLLDYLQYHYRLDADTLDIERVQSGAERIVAGNRRFTPSDFLTKRMHLSWPEAKRILRTVHDGQQKGEWKKRSITSKVMWARFERYERRLPGMVNVRRDYKTKRDMVRITYAYHEDPKQSKAQNAVRRRLLRQYRKTEIAKLKDAFEAEMQYYLLRPHERYLDYLYDAAEQGDRAALRELQRIYPRYEQDDPRQIFEIRIRERRQPLTQFSPEEMGYKIKIKRNGTVEYRNSVDEAVIVDTYTSIKVIDRDTEVIANALALAKIRYGVSGFEIRNAQVGDIAAIRAAVERTGVSVSVLPKTTTENDKRLRTNAQGDLGR